MLLNWYSYGTGNPTDPLGESEMKMPFKGLPVIWTMVLVIMALGITFGSVEMMSGENGLPKLTPTFSTGWPIITPSNAHQITLLATLQSTEQDPWIEDIAFSPDSAILATVDPWGTVVLWNSRTASELSLLKASTIEDGWGNRNKVVFSPDGSLLTYSIGADIYLWDVNNVLTTHDLTPRTVLRGYSNGVQALVFSPDGTVLASCDRTQSPDSTNTVRLWEISTGRVLMRANVSGVGSCCLSFSSDGGTFYWSEEAITHVWSIEKKREIETFPGRLPWLSPDGTTKLVWVRMDNGNSAIQLEDAKTGEVKATLQKDTPVGQIAAFSPDGVILATGDTDESGYGIDLWQVASGRLLTTIEGPGAITSLSFSPDGTLLADGENGAGLGIAHAHIWVVHP